MLHFYKLCLNKRSYGTNFLDFLKELTEHGEEVPAWLNRQIFVEGGTQYPYKSVKSYLLDQGRTYFQVAERKRITEYDPSPSTLDLVVVTINKNFVPELIEKFDSIEVIADMPTT